MANESVTALAGGGKHLLAVGLSAANVVQTMWECEAVTGQADFLAKVLGPRDDADEAELVLTYYERRGLAAVLRGITEHANAIWTEVLGPLECAARKETTS